MKREAYLARILYPGLQRETNDASRTTDEENGLFAQPAGCARAIRDRLHAMFSSFLNCFLTPSLLSEHPRAPGLLSLTSRRDRQDALRPSWLGKGGGHADSDRGRLRPRPEGSRDLTAGYQREQRPVGLVAPPAS